MPTHDFIDIGDVLNYELLQGQITTIDDSTDTCTVKIGSTVYSAIIFYHCKPDSTLRSNGAIQDGATGFVVGDLVFVMKKKGSTVLSETKVVGHVEGARHCDLGGEGYIVFWKDEPAGSLNASLANFGQEEVTELSRESAALLSYENNPNDDGIVPVIWNLKKFRHIIERNGVPTEADLYYIFTNIIIPMEPYIGWKTYCDNHPDDPLVSNKYNTEIEYSDSLMVALRQVNYDVNHAHSYVSDPAGTDNWKIMGTGESGDCEDFALTKANILLGMGYPASALHIECSEIRDYDPGQRSGHGWLVVQTTQGDFALDLNVDEVVSNASLTLGGKELFTRRRQTGRNWAFISPFSFLHGAITVNHHYAVSYIFDPELNIIYPLPRDSYDRPFRWPSRSIYFKDFTFAIMQQHYQDNFPASPSINFSEDNQWIYYATPVPPERLNGGYGLIYSTLNEYPNQRIYKYKLKDNELYLESSTDIPLEIIHDGLTGEPTPARVSTSNGFVQRDGTLRNGHPVLPQHPDCDPTYYDYMRPWWWNMTAEVISPDGYYDFQYEYVIWSLWPPSTIQH